MLRFAYGQNSINLLPITGCTPSNVNFGDRCQLNINISLTGSSHKSINGTISIISPIPGQAQIDAPVINIGANYKSSINPALSVKMNSILGTSQVINLYIKN